MPPWRGRGMVENPIEEVVMVSDEDWKIWEWRCKHEGLLAMLEDIRDRFVSLSFILRRKYHLSLKVTPQEEKAFSQLFALAIRKASDRLNEDCTPATKRKFIHLYCGRTFPTSISAQEHAKKGTCRASKQTMQARRAKAAILKKRAKE